MLSRCQVLLQTKVLGVGQVAHQKLIQKCNRQVLVDCWTCSRVFEKTPRGCGRSEGGFQILCTGMNYCARGVPAKMRYCGHHFSCLSEEGSKC